jgi:hypothetical protein
MTKGNSLVQLQTYFSKQLILMLRDHTIDQQSSTELDLLSSQLVESNFSSEQLINIYRNNFLISISELLEQLFPVTQALVGSDYFTQTSRQFIHDCPLKEPHLNHYGGNFVSFLGELEVLKKMPFVTQMAELEWQLDRISHIHYEPNFDFDALSQIGEDQYLDIHFSLADICYLQSSNMDLIALHKDLSSPQETKHQDASYQQQSYILVLQNQQGKSAYMPVNHQQWTWLNGLQNSFTLAQLCGAENTNITPLMEQITDWIALGCIDGFSLKTNI